MRIPAPGCSRSSRRPRAAGCIGDAAADGSPEPEPGPVCFVVDDEIRRAEATREERADLLRLSGGAGLDDGGGERATRPSLGLLNEKGLPLGSDVPPHLALRPVPRRGNCAMRERNDEVVDAVGEEGSARAGGARGRWKLVRGACAIVSVVGVSPGRRTRGEVEAEGARCPTDEAGAVAEARARRGSLLPRQRIERVGLLDTGAAVPRGESGLGREAAGLGARGE